MSNTRAKKIWSRMIKQQEERLYARKMICSYVLEFFDSYEEHNHTVTGFVFDLKTKGVIPELLTFIEAANISTEKTYIDYIISGIMVTSIQIENDGIRIGILIPRELIE